MSRIFLIGRPQPSPLRPSASPQSRRWFDKLTTLSTVEGSIEEPAHPTPANKQAPFWRARERVAAFIVKGDPK